MKRKRVILAVVASGLLLPGSPAAGAERVRLALRLSAQRVEEVREPLTQFGVQGVRGVSNVGQQTLRDLAARLQRSRGLLLVKETEHPQVVVTLIQERFAVGIAGYAGFYGPGYGGFGVSGAAVTTLDVEGRIVGDPNPRPEMIECSGKKLEEAVKKCDKAIRKWAKAVRPELGSSPSP